ncbi:MerR family transcriptional regulator [Microbulbifer sp. 2201CG32-9]|uniref:MerR family transcriptional regulator n=1 Tax=Microbulbifer sp. 2201CG32-9 TaxID=3232309 RepID=UPI00345BF623
MPWADSAADAAARLPIRQVARRTGVNPVTLRAWERRYGLLAPQRTAKGHRLYSEAEVARIGEILSWLARGVAISRVRPLLERVDASGQLEMAEGHWERLVRLTAASVAQLDAGQLRACLEHILARYSPSLVHDHWLVPLQRRLSGQMHFGAALARAYFWQLLTQRLAVMPDESREARHRNGGKGPRLLLVSFPGMEQQAFAALFSRALTCRAFNVVNLPAEADLGELAFAEKQLGVQGIICYSHNALPTAILGEGMARTARSLQVPLWFAGGLVSLQRRDLQPFISAGLCRLLPEDCAGAVRRLREPW